MRKIVMTIVLLLLVCPSLIVEGKAEEGFDLEGDAKLETTQDLLDICSLDKEHPQYTKAASFCLGFIIIINCAHPVYRVFFAAFRFHKAPLSCTLSRPVLCCLQYTHIINHANYSEWQDVLNK